MYYSLILREERVAFPSFMPGADRVQILETAWKIEKK